MINGFKLAVLLTFITGHLSLFAEEGMWIPMLLNKHISHMQQMGCRLSAEDIYDINHASLKDAIVRFGRGCTGEVVSQYGLLLTNHHCGYGIIQRHSTLDHDYLTDGYWASSLQEELPNPGLTVTFLVRMEDVTSRVLEGIIGILPEQARDSLIRRNSSRIAAGATEGTRYDARVIPFFEGNQYLLYITEEFKDIRFVGAPPSGIGNFGGDTDNWMWPRHTGDFSVFRIYADTNNQPAEYSEKNVPYRPKTFLPVSLGGYEEGDFTLLFGNPGTTREYLPAAAVNQIVCNENPVRIRLRQKRLDIIGYASDTSHLVRIQYASKRARIANYWKKMIGESRGINRVAGVAEKRQFEDGFRIWASDRAGEGTDYTGILHRFDELYEALTPVNVAEIYLREAGMAPEIFQFALAFGDLIRKAEDDSGNQETIREEVSRLQRFARGFYRDYQPSVDRQITVEMLKEMQSNMDPAFLPERFSWIGKRYHGDVEAYTNDLFSSSILADSTRLYGFLQSYGKKSTRRLTQDPAWLMAVSVDQRYRDQVLPSGKAVTRVIDSLQRIYMKAQMEMKPDHQFYPDANGTMRVCYGQVRGFAPADGVTYRYYTTASGILEKEDPTIYDYAVDRRLKELVSAADFGRYADRDGSMHVAFISTVHSTGGNSGAPVLNGNGELIGIHFDRNWEGTMSDLIYDPDQCRNIILDIRYLLFIMDKYAGATWLVDEMEIREKVVP